MQIRLVIIDNLTCTSAYIVYLGLNPILWRFKKQRIVACSSTKEKYHFVARTLVELHWVCLHLIELNVYVPQISMIYCDNVGATHFYSNPVFSFSHETCCIESLLHLWTCGALYVTHVFFENQLFNMLTKPHSFKNRTGPIGSTIDRSQFWSGSMN